MLLLYTATTCPFCRRVEDFLQDKGIDFEARNIQTDEHLVDELIEVGGKRQIPFLVDTQRGVSMYESDDIIQYVIDTYGETPYVGT